MALTLMGDAHFVALIQFCFQPPYRARARSKCRPIRRSPWVVSGRWNKASVNGASTTSFEVTSSTWIRCYFCLDHTFSFIYVWLIPRKKAQPVSSPFLSHAIDSSLLKRFAQTQDIVLLVFSSAALARGGSGLLGRFLSCSLEASWAWVSDGAAPCAFGSAVWPVCLLDCCSGSGD